MASKRLKKKMQKRKDNIENILVHRVIDQTENIATQIDQNPEIQSVRKENSAMGKEQAQEKKSGSKKTMVYFQFQGKEIEEQEVIGMIKKVWKDEGNMMKDLKELLSLIHI